MGFRRPDEGEVIGPNNLTQSVRSGRYVFELFMNDPVCLKKGELTTPGGTDLAECVVMTGRHSFEYTFIGDATDTFLPLLASEGGYNWALTTATLARGVEINFGGLLGAHPRNHVPSTEDWFARILLITEDASGTDAFFGFRKAAAYAETLTEYSDVSGIRLLGDSSSTTAATTLITNLNNAGSTDFTSTTNTTTLEDATAIELEVRNIGGKAYYFINSGQQTGVSYTYDSGDIMSPILRLLQSTDISSQLKTLCYEAGPYRDRQPGTLLSLAGSTI